MSGFWDGVADTIGVVAPTLGAALGGPLGGMAGAMIAKALGVDPANPEQAANILKTASAEQLLVLKKAENDFTIALRELDIKAADISGRDRDSARQREIALKDRVPGLLALLLTVGFFGLLGWLVGHEPPSGSRDILNIMLGSLGTGWATMLAYYFGSSQGSDAKTGIIRKLAEG